MPRSPKLSLSLKLYAFLCSHQQSQTSSCWIARTAAVDSSTNHQPPVPARSPVTSSLLDPNTRVGTLIVATIYLQLIQNRYMFRSFTVLQCSHQHCVQPVASDVEVVGYI